MCARYCCQGNNGAPEKKQQQQNRFPGNSLAVQLLRLGALTAVPWVRSLIRELRSHKPHGTAKKQNKTKTDFLVQYKL